MPMTRLRLPTLALLVALAPLAAAQSLPPGRDRDFTCPSCACLAATGQAVFAASARGEETVAPPTQCGWAVRREEGHLGDIFLASSARNFAKTLTDDGARDVCSRLWNRMVEHVRQNGRAWCATDIAVDAPAEIRETLAHCDQDSYLTWTILDQDAFIAAAVEDTDIDPAACPVAKQIHIDLWGSTRFEAMAWLAAAGIVENLESHLRAEPGIEHAVAHILQHGEVNPPQQKRALPVFEELGRKGLIAGKTVARLTDEVLKGEGKQQRYGTFFSCEGDRIAPNPPLEDPGQVNERRRAIGIMQTIEEHIASYGDRCKAAQVQGAGGG